MLSATQCKCAYKSPGVASPGQDEGFYLGVPCQYFIKQEFHMHGILQKMMVCMIARIHLGHYGAMSLGPSE